MCKYHDLAEAIRAGSKLHPQVTFGYYEKTARLREYGTCGLGAAYASKHPIDEWTLDLEIEAELHKEYPYLNQDRCGAQLSNATIARERTRRHLKASSLI